MKVKVYTLKDLDTNFLYDITDKKQLEKAKKLYPNHTIIESTTNIHYYIEISLLNNRGQEFEKGFDDLKSATVFLNKLRRGNSLRITSIMCPDDSILNVLNYYSREVK